MSAPEIPAGVDRAADGRLFTAALADIPTARGAAPPVTTVPMPPSRPSGHPVLDTLSRFGSSAERLASGMQALGAEMKASLGTRRSQAGLVPTSADFSLISGVRGSAVLGPPRANGDGQRLASLGTSATGAASPPPDAGDAAGRQAVPGPAERNVPATLSPDLDAMRGVAASARMFTWNLMSAELQMSLFGKATRTPGRIVDTLVKQNG